MFRTILAPVDLADLDVARPAIEKAVALANASGGALRLINVQPLLPPSYMDYVPVGFDEAQRDEAKARLDELAAKVPLPRDRVSSVVRIGGVYPELLAEAEEWPADLIVVGAHKRSMATYLLGSTATALSRHAKCTVMIVRSPIKAKLL